MAWTDRKSLVIAAGVRLAKAQFRWIQTAEGAFVQTDERLPMTRREAHLLLCAMLDTTGSLAYLRHVADKAERSGPAWARLEKDIFTLAKEHGAIITD